MKQITAVIVEDEELPRLSLEEKINTFHPDIQIVGMYAHCDTALEGILKLAPDMMFLDIQMPEKNSLWLVNTLQSTSSVQLPYIIFTTAYNSPEYLFKAIKFSAVDYLLKPIALNELAEAIIKVKKKIKESAEKNFLSKIYSFKTLNSMLLLKESDIVFCEADGNYCQLLLANNTKEMIFERLGDLEEKFCGDTNIIRAGRKHLINIIYISKLNTQKNICHFHLPSQINVTLHISEGGMENIRKAL